MYITIRNESLVRERDEMRMPLGAQRRMNMKVCRSETPLSTDTKVVLVLCYRWIHSWERRRRRRRGESGKREKNSRTPFYAADDAVIIVAVWLDTRSKGDKTCVENFKGRISSMGNQRSVTQDWLAWFVFRTTMVVPITAGPLPHSRVWAPIGKCVQPYTMCV